MKKQNATTAASAGIATPTVANTITAATAATASLVWNADVKSASRTTKITVA